MIEPVYSAAPYRYEGKMKSAQMWQERNPFA